MIPHLRFHVRSRSPIMGPEAGFELHAIHCAERRRAIAEPIQFRELTDDERDGLAMDELLSPALCLTEEDAQRLIDAMWDAGLRPTGSHGSAGQLAATELHLEDMRRLVFQGGKGKD